MAVAAHLVAGHARGQHGAQLPDERSFTTFALVEEPKRADVAALPDRVDLSPFVPEAGSQGATNTCTGWAVGYGLCTTVFTGLVADSAQASLNTRTPDRLYSPSFIYALALGSGRCNGNVRLSHALKVAVDTGCCTWGELPFDTAQVRRDCRRVPAQARTRAAPFRLVGSTRLPQRKPDALREALAAGNLIVFSVCLDSSFRTDGWTAGGSQPFTWHPVGFDTVSHAMLCMGYDDADQSFLMLNSWGTHWGLHGTFRMPYDVAKRYITEAYAVPMAMRAWELTPAPTASDTTLHFGRHFTTKLDEGESVRHRELRLTAADITSEADSLLMRVHDDDTGAELHRLALREDRSHTVYHEGVAYEIDFTDEDEGAARVRVTTRPQERDRALRRALRYVARFAH